MTETTDSRDVKIGKILDGYAGIYKRCLKVADEVLADGQKGEFMEADPQQRIDIARDIFNRYFDDQISMTKESKIMEVVTNMVAQVTRGRLP